MKHRDKGAMVAALQGRSEMAQLTRTFDWSRTPVGPIEHWSRSLKTIVGTVIDSPNPMFLWWGPELIQFYNDAYIPLLGRDRHPSALGAHGQEFWENIWHIIGPQIDSVIHRGEAVWHRDYRVPILRDGRMQEAFWTYGYSAVHDDDEHISGVLVVAQDVTKYVLSKRRHKTLHAISTLASTERAEYGTARGAIEIMDQDPDDIPFALCYLLDVDGAHASLTGTAGLTPGRTYAPLWIPMNHSAHAQPNAEAMWPVARAVEQRKTQTVYDVSERFSLPPSSRWHEPPSRALVFPLLNAETSRPLGALVLGANPQLPLDGSYRSFLKSVASRTSAAITAAAAEAARNRLLMARRGDTAIRDQSGDRTAAAQHPAESVESRLAEVFQQAPTFMCITRGPEFVFELVNEAYYQLVGHRDLLGKTFAEAFPELREAGLGETASEALKKGKPFVGRELRVMLQRTPGAPLEERFIDVVYQPLAEPDGSFSILVTHGSDVTEQVRARRYVEQLLRESEDALHALETAHGATEAAREEAVRANKAKAEFLTVMSHELRTPLNAISGYTQILQMGVHGPLTPAMQEDLARIQRNQAHLLGLINSVLNYAKLEAGEMEYRLTRIPIAGLLREVETLVTPVGLRKSLTLEFTPCDESLAIMADAEKVRQILLNLLTNATKFTPSGGRIRVGCSFENSNMVAIQVSDTGVGIPPEQQSRIFDPFVQVGRDLTTTNEGVGLGLPISHDLARGMGGDLTVHSVVGKGTTFTLTLPSGE